MSQKAINNSSLGYPANSGESDREKIYKKHFLKYERLICVYCKYVLSALPAFIHTVCVPQWPFINRKNGWFTNLLCKYKVVYKLENLTPRVASQYTSVFCNIMPLWIKYKYTDCLCRRVAIYIHLHSNEYLCPNGCTFRKRTWHQHFRCEEQIWFWIQQNSSHSRVSSVPR